MRVAANSKNVSVYFYIVGNTVASSPWLQGEPVTGLLYSDIETGGSASYLRSSSARQDILLVTTTPGALHTDGGFVEVDATNMPGIYKCDVPDIAFVPGVDEVLISIVAAAANEVVAEPVRVDLVDDTNTLVETTINGLTSQTLFTLVDGSTDDDAYNNDTIIVIDVTTSTQRAVGKILDYTGSTKTVRLSFNPGIFGMSAGDTVRIIAGQ